MKKHLTALLAIVTYLFTAPLWAQSNMSAVNTPQINSTFYVDSVPGFNSTIQATVTAACATGGNRVVSIPAGYTGTDLISGVTGGCTSSYIKDERAVPNACYTWSGSAYASTNCGSGGGGSPGGSSYSIQYNVPGTPAALGGATINGPACGNGTTGAPGLCTPTQMQTAIGSNVYDSYNAATSAIANLIAGTTTWSGTNTFANLLDSSLAGEVGQCLQVGASGSFAGSGLPCSYAAQHIGGAEIRLNMLPSYISGTTIEDISGNENNATMCTGAAAPTPTTVGLVMGSISSCVALPAAVNNLRTFEYAIFVPATGSDGNAPFGVILAPSQQYPTAPIYFLSAYYGVNNTFTNTGMSIYNYGGQTLTGSNVQLSSGNHTVIVTLGTSSSDPDHIYFDGVEVSPYNAQSYSAGKMTSGNLYLGESPSEKWDSALITDYEFVGYSTELTAAQVGQEHDALVSDMQLRGAGNLGVQWSNVGPRWIAYGDSITACYLITSDPDCWVNQPPSPVPTFSSLLNYGNPGKTASYLMGTDSLYYAFGCSTNSGPNMATVMDGTNDFGYYSNATPQSVSGYIANQVQLLANNGCRVFVGTMISRGSSPAPPNGQTWATNQQGLDALIRQNWKVWGASGILDFAADPNLGCAACSSNATYYQSDYTHLQDAGYLLMQSAAWQAMEYYFGYTKSNPNTLTAATYSMVASDGYIEYAGTAAATLTLPSCVGQSGAVYTINNQTTFALTIKNLNSTQPINGTDYSTAGLAVAAGPNFTVTDVPDPLGATSGCHWSY